MAIQIRRGTKAEWDANNSNIIAGEPAIALDTADVFVGTVSGEYVELASKDYVDSKTSGSGLTNEAKQALLACFENVAWINTSGQDLIDALELALYPPADLRSISATYTQSGVVYNTDQLDSLRDDLVVTAIYDDSSTSVVTAYTLSGTLSVGTSTITVSYGGKTTTFNVTVSRGAIPERTVSMADVKDASYEGRRFGTAELEPSGSYANACISYYLSVNPGTTVSFSGMDYPSMSNTDIIFYNYEKTSVVGSGNLAYGSWSFTAPSDAYWFRFNMGINDTHTVTYTPYE